MAVTLTNMRHIANVAIIGATVQPSQPIGGSLLFNNGMNQTVYMDTNSDWSFSTEDDFTIEWFQLMSDPSSAVRPFSVGAYPSAQIAVSIEGGNTFYFWQNGSPALSVAVTDFLDVWTHFAITRESGIIRVFQNGVNISGDVSDSGSFDDIGTQMTIGGEDAGEGAVSAGTQFNGNITNFRWMKGLAAYNANFAVPTAPLPSGGSETKFLMLATDETHAFFDTRDNYFINNFSGVTWSAETPFSG